MSDFRIFRASRQDVEIILDVLSDAAVVPLAKGIVQWPTRFPKVHIDDLLERNEVYLVADGREVIATFAVGWDDPSFWPDPNGSAAYVYKLGIRGSHRGQGLTVQLLEWVSNLATQRRRSCIRIDVLLENTELRAFYERIGFQHVADTDFYASLYQRPISIA